MTSSSLLRPIQRISLVSILQVNYKSEFSANVSSENKSFRCKSLLIQGQKYVRDVLKQTLRFGAENEMMLGMFLHKASVTLLLTKF